MKSGFRATLEKIFRDFYVPKQGVHGTVWAVGDTMWKIVSAMGYRVENGISNSYYDYVILSEKKSKLENVLLALSKIDYGCVVIFRVSSDFSVAYNYIPGTKLTLYKYGDNKYLGVLLKRKETV